MTFSDFHLGIPWRSLDLPWSPLVPQRSPRRPPETLDRQLRYIYIYRYIYIIHIHIHIHYTYTCTYTYTLYTYTYTYTTARRPSARPSLPSCLPEWKPLLYPFDFSRSPRGPWGPQGPRRDPGVSPDRPQGGQGAPWASPSGSLWLLGSP